MLFFAVTQRTGYRQGRLVPPNHGQEAPPRAGNRKGEQTPVHLPRSVRCEAPRSGTASSYMRICSARSPSRQTLFARADLFSSSRSRIRRRRPALPSRRLPGPRPLWPHLLQHGAHERRGYPVCVLSVFYAPCSFCAASPTRTWKLTRHRITGNWRSCTASRSLVEREFLVFAASSINLRKLIASGPCPQLRSGDGGR